MPDFRIAVLPGDGIGPDVTAEGRKTLRAVESAIPELRFHCDELSVGAGEFLRSGNPLPDATMEAMKDYDAILLGAMGLPGVRWPDGKEMTPQIDIREVLDLYCGLRPIRTYHADDSPLKRGADIDFVLIRENTEGLFFGRHGSADLNGDQADDTMRITRHASVRLFHSAFKLARERRKKVTLVDKANVLPTMAYFRHIFQQVAAEYPDVATEACYVDAAALFLVRRPQDFDVMATENMFGDILSDLAAGLVGGMGMAPSGDIGDKYAVFQPSHGTAPDIAGKGIANPIAMILSTAMMLDWLPGEASKEGGRLLHRAVESILADPSARTPDVGGTMKTHEMGDRIAAAVLGVIQGHRVFDTHTHIGTARHSGRVFTADQMLRSMDKEGVDRSLLIPFPLVDDYRAQHDEIGAAVRQWPDRFAGAACLNPFVKESEFRDEVRRCAESFGFRGLKLQPMYQPLNPVSRGSDFFFETAQANAMAVVAHTGSGVPFPLPSLFIAAARRFPELPIVLGHAGGPLLLLECAVAADVCPNIYVEVSSLMPHHLSDLMQYVPASRLMVGSDLPESVAGRNRKGFSVEMSEPDRAALLWNTGAKLFGA